MGQLRRYSVGEAAPFVESAHGRVGFSVSSIGSLGGKGFVERLIQLFVEMPSLARSKRAFEGGLYVQEYRPDLDVDPHALKVRDVMTRKPVVITKDDSIEDSVREMRCIGVRRMPVISQGGNLVGVVSIDYVLETLAEELGNIAVRSETSSAPESALRT